MPKPPPRKWHLPRRDDLPTIKAADLRKAGVIDAAMTSVVIELAGYKREVGLWLMRWPGGGSWSYFICPSCSRRCQKLRLHDGRLVCRRCDGLLARCQTGDKGPALERLRHLSISNPGEPSGRPTKRHRLHLRRALIVARRARLEGWK